MAEEKKPVRKKSALKAARASARRAVFNARRRKALKDAVKRMSRFVSGKNLSEAQAFFATFQKAVDKAAKGGLIKPNAAARLKSRIAKRVRTIAA